MNSIGKVYRHGTLFARVNFQPSRARGSKEFSIKTINPNPNPIAFGHRAIFKNMDNIF